MHDPYDIYLQVVFHVLSYLKKKLQGKYLILFKGEHKMVENIPSSNLGGISYSLFTSTSSCDLLSLMCFCSFIPLVPVFQHIVKILFFSNSYYIGVPG